MVIVVTLLCHGCPLQAIIAAFGLEERTVTAWQGRLVSMVSGCTST
ncbi:MAG: hypothetical protein HY689_04300 [Chloroflexi bacterium]|nr:hypothetical protein [Chloroflexota bacterium]